MTDNKSINASDGVSKGVFVKFWRGYYEGLDARMHQQVLKCRLNANNTPASGVNPTHSLETQY
jgi:hypothetical protein